MQPKSDKVVNGAAWRCLTALILAVLTSSGCSKKPPAPPTVIQPFSGVQLKIACADEAVLKVFADRARGWAARNGAKVEAILCDPEQADRADVLITNPVQFGKLAEKGVLAHLPAEFKTLEHPGDWVRLLPAYRERLTGWAGEVQGIPLAGEARLLMVRTDRLQAEPLTKKYSEKFRRPIPPKPETWDDLAEIAEASADLKQPALPPRTAQELQSLEDYFRIAACYDRPAWTETDLAKKDGTAPTSMDLLSFLFTADTGEPRLGSPGFADALNWFRRVAPARLPSGTNAETALTQGQAVFAVIDLAALRRIAKSASAEEMKHLLILPLPGTRRTRDREGRPIDCTNQLGGNYVPYYGGGWIGVVPSASSSSLAAFELLADLASPPRSLELLSDPNLAFGPFRLEHLENTRESVWQLYGLDAMHQSQLVEALRRNAAASIISPALPPRGPEAAELIAKLRIVVESGKSDDLPGLWKRPDTQLKSLRRHAAGLP